MSCEPPSFPADTPPDARQRQLLRNTLRHRRRSLSPNQQRLAARHLAIRLQRHPLIRQAREVAAYLAHDGEIDPSTFLRWAQQQGKTVWLPVVCDDNLLHPLGLRFAAAPRLDQSRGWQRNRYGIREPRSRRRIAPARLDVLLMPLVGFDASGHRLGMGGGYYDRLLSQLSRQPRRPRCLGLAHRCQEVPDLPVAHWDQPVDAVIVA